MTTAELGIDLEKLTTMPAEDRASYILQRGVAMLRKLNTCYEFIEWWSAVALGQGADAFLGTQGDPWDTQWDMFTALLGALAAQLLFARLHDKQVQIVYQRQTIQVPDVVAAPLDL